MDIWRIFSGRTACLPTYFEFRMFVTFVHEKWTFGRRDLCKCDCSVSAFATFNLFSSKKKKKLKKVVKAAG